MPSAFLIAMVGGSGAGKTWLAERLRQALGPSTGHISLDDFYGDLSHLSPPQRERVNFDDPRAVDWEAVGGVIEAMRQGQPTPLPRYDFATHTRDPQPTLWTPRSVVIWEGLWLLHHSWLRQKFHFSIYVDCPATERLARRCARDVRERGRSRGSVERQFRDHVLPMHEQFVAPQKRWAKRCVGSPLSEAELSLLLADVGAAVEEWLQSGAGAESVGLR